MMSKTPTTSSRWPAVAMAVAPWALVAAGCGSERAAATDDTPSNARPAMDGATSAAQPPTAAARPKLRPGAKTVALKRAGDRPFDKTFDDLRFEMDLDQPFRREMLTPAIEDLAGRHIRIRGYILPTAQQRGIKQFVLVRDNQECCFGQGAALFDCILVEMIPGQATEFSIRPVAVAGTFDVREFVGPDGRHLAIYHLQAESVE